MAQEYKLKGITSLDLQPGEKHEVEVEGLDAKVLLLNAAGKTQAIGPRCTHYGYVTCGMYDLATWNPIH